MRPPEDAQVAAWLAKVVEDSRVAEALAELAEPLEDAICFHCQQAAENLLKAALEPVHRSVSGLGRPGSRQTAFAYAADRRSRELAPPRRDR